MKNVFPMFTTFAIGCIKFRFLFRTQKTTSIIKHVAHYYSMYKCAFHIVCTYVYVYEYIFIQIYIICVLVSKIQKNHISL